MFPNNVSFLARERDKERYQEVEHIRLVKIARSQQDHRDSMLWKLAYRLGSQMVQWGTKLQSFGSVRLPKVSSIEPMKVIKR